jgi:hypothetical protein
LYDPIAALGTDRSLRLYLHTASSGRADLDVVVMPMRTIDEQHVPPDRFENEMGPQLPDAGFEAAALVTLGGPGAGMGQRGGFWARFVMAAPGSPTSMATGTCGSSSGQGLPRAITNSRHVIFGSPDGSLHELEWESGTRTQYLDLTSQYGLPPVDDDPAAIVVEGAMCQHVVFQGTTGHIYEVIW